MTFLLLLNWRDWHSHFTDFSKLANNIEIGPQKILLMKKTYKYNVLASWLFLGSILEERFHGRKFNTDAHVISAA